MTATPTADTVADLKAQLEEERKLRLAAEAEAKRLSPTVDIRGMLFRNTDEVREFFGPKKIKELVDTRLAADNKALNRQGFDRISLTKEEREEFTEEMLQSFIDDRRSVTPPIEGPLTRTIKMVTPDGLSLRQMIFEGQVNNTAGSLADGILVYQNKGFKRTDPMLCPSMDCWEPSAVVTSGKGKGRMEFTGYCSQDHYNRTESRQSRTVPGAEA